MALLVGMMAALPAKAEPPLARAKCQTARDLVRLTHPLSHVAHKLAQGLPVTIVAIGSSSTAGSGASSPAANYPSRLAVELKKRFTGQSITVINRGVGGEVITDMLKRFDRAVVAARPDLVLWQLGTNSVIRNGKLADDAVAIHEGLARLRAIEADVVLIDPQYAPKVIKKPDAARMVALIAAAAKEEDVDLYPRFELMKRWREQDHLGFETFVSADGLHMNDWSYSCMAKSLGQAIADAVNRPVVSAKAVTHTGP